MILSHAAAVKFDGGGFLMQALTNLILEEHLQSASSEQLFEVVTDFLKNNPQRFKKFLNLPDIDIGLDYINFKADWDGPQTINIWATQIDLNSGKKQPPAVEGIINVTPFEVGIRVIMTFYHPAIVWDESGEIFDVTNPRYVRVLRNQGVDVQTYDSAKILEAVFYHLARRIIHFFNGDRAAKNWEQWLNELKPEEVMFYNSMSSTAQARPHVSQEKKNKAGRKRATPQEIRAKKRLLKLTEQIRPKCKNYTEAISKAYQGLDDEDQIWWLDSIPAPSTVRGWRNLPDE